jgi:peptide/nickel transport system permease protein
VRSLRVFLARWQNILGIIFVILHVVMAIGAPWISPQDDPDNPTAFKQVDRYPSLSPKPPSEEAFLGTTPGSIDVFHNMVWGSRSAFRLGFVITMGTAVVGTLIGALSAFFGGMLNSVVMRITDAFLAFPIIAGVALFTQVLHPERAQLATQGFIATLIDLGIGPLVITLILFSWMPYARLINANIMRIKEETYIHASRAMGAGNMRLIFRHLLPNSISPVVVLAARDIGAMVILAASFTFIGVAGGSEWGTLLVTGRAWIIGPGGSPFIYWWTFIPVTLAIITFGIGWNLIGDGLNILINPELERKIANKSIEQKYSRKNARNRYYQRGEPAEGIASGSE